MTEKTSGETFEKPEYLFLNCRDAFPLTDKIPHSDSCEEILDRLSEDLYNRIMALESGGKPHKAKYALKILLLNLHRSRLLMRAVYYSRSPNRYSKKGIFSALPFNSILWAINGLNRLGLITHKKGFHGRTSGAKSHMSRFMASPKMIRYLNHERFPVILAEPEDLKPLDPVEYKKNKKRYPASIFTKYGRAAAKPVDEYNKYISRHELTATMNGDTEFTIPSLQRFLSDLIQGKRSITKMKMPEFDLSFIPNISDFKIEFNDLSEKEENFYYRQIRILFLLFRYLKLNPDIKPDSTFPLKRLSFSEITYRINALYLYRVFMDEKLTICGRFYAKTLYDSKAIRLNYKFDGKEVVEFDYESTLPRLAYHSKGIDYRADIYSEPFGTEYREMVKKIITYAMNTKNRDRTIRAIRNNFKRKKILLPPCHSIEAALDAIEKAHKPIKDFFHRQSGLKVRNFESTIMGNILISLVKLDIPTLPIHDSLVIPRENAGEVKEIMKCEYRKIMKFDPVIK